ncbi:MAG: hypothetical protein WCX88_01895 [Patescibacteria group bacterium]
MQTKLQTQQKTATGTKVILSIAIISCAMLATAFLIANISFFRNIFAGKGGNISAVISHETLNLK